MATCEKLQAEMLVWGQDNVFPPAPYDGSILSLISKYQTDPDSGYTDVRYASRLFYDKLCLRIGETAGHLKVTELNVRQIKRLHETWSDNGNKITMGHSCVRMMRMLLSFGDAILEDKACEALRGKLKLERFHMAPPRSSILTYDMANAIRREAHAAGLHSIALAQALQYECLLRQKDVIGEWVPVLEPGPPSDIAYGGERWIRGLRWGEIDRDYILKHITSKRQKPIEINLRLAGMVWEELERIPQDDRIGALVVCERTCFPWKAGTFRHLWRVLARRAGVPDTVRSMDSRAGGITEATMAGAPLESIKQAATHSDIAMTQRYSRASAEKTEEVMRARSAYRNASKTK